MALILSRNTQAGSAGIVTNGDSTTVYGDLPASGDTIQWLRVADFSIGETVTSVLVDDLSGTGSGVEGARFVTGHEASGTMRLAATYVEMGAVLAWVMGGTPATSGSGPYTHVYGNSLAAPFRSIFQVYQAADGTSLQTELHACQANGFTLEVDAQSVAYLTVPVTGAVALRSTVYQLGVAATETPAAAAMTSAAPVLGPAAGVLSFGGNSVACRSLSFTKTRTLDRGADFGASYPGEGSISALDKFELTVTRAADEADSATIRAAHMAGTAADTSITFTSGSKTLTIALSDAVITAYSAPFTSGGALIETVTFTAQALTSSDFGAKITIVNAASSAVTTNGTVA
jgi:hypothetical protein